MISVNLGGGAGLGEEQEGRGCVATVAGDEGDDRDYTDHYGIAWEIRKEETISRNGR
jgi:hypothetical protein